LLKKKGKKPQRDAKNVELRQRAFSTLREQGFSLTQAGEIVGYSQNSKSYLSRHVEAKRQRGLLTPLIPLAKKALKATLRGEAVGQADLPKASDIMRAAEMVLDREEPKVQRMEQLSANVTTIPPERLRELLVALDLPHLADERDSIEVKSGVNEGVGD